MPSCCAVLCPLRRSLVAVKHKWPYVREAVPHVDPRAPYRMDNFTILTGCSASFFDRLVNAVASLQVGV